MAKKMWAGRFEKATDKEVNDYNSSLPFDCKMYSQDIEGSIAHSQMLAKQGVISEKGSLLSHTAIISREIGIPSIVGVKDLILTVQSGDLIRMNGDKGKIEILKRSSNT